MKSSPTLAGYLSFKEDCESSILSGFTRFLWQVPRARVRNLQDLNPEIACGNLNLSQKVFIDT